MISKLFEALHKHEKFISGIVIRKTHTKTAVCEVKKLYFDKGKYACLDYKTTRYMIHDPQDECSIGDRVHFKACRPISKKKCHVLEKIVTKDQANTFIQANPQYIVTNQEINQQREINKSKYTHIKDL